MNALIIAGGFSSRMGRDKAEIIRPDGARQLDHVAALLRTVCDQAWIAIRPGADLKTTLPLIEDRRPGLGPLAALESAFLHQAGPWLVVACDLFLLDETTLRFLMEKRDPTRLATAFRNRLDGRAEPLCAIYESDGLAQVAHALDRGERGARWFLESLDPQLLDLPNPVALDSANTPMELAECFAKLQSGAQRKSVELWVSDKFAEPMQVETWACTLGGLFHEVCFRHFLRIELSDMEANVNGIHFPWETFINDGSRVSFRKRTTE